MFLSPSLSLPGSRLQHFPQETELRSLASDKNGGGEEEALVILHVINGFFNVLSSLLIILPSNALKKLLYSASEGDEVPVIMRFPNVLVPFHESHMYYVSYAVLSGE